jgi:hypothetical protein
MRFFLSADVIDAEIGSSSWIAAIGQALVASGAAIVLITGNSLGSKWVEEEWRKYYQTHYCVAFLLEVQSRRVQVIGCTPYPNEAFVLQCLPRLT